MMPRTLYRPLRYVARWGLVDTHARSLIKTVTWRITGSFATFLIAWLVGGNLAAAGTIAAVQLVANTMLYYVHERIWNRVRWGR
jgi:uncharacterized membrane protein